jgi:predicted nucleic acid-binding protein
MKASPKYVVDASVVVKWFSGLEEDGENSEKLLSSHVEGTSPLASSSLVLYEVCNALRFNPNFGEDDLLKAARSLLKLELELVDFPEVFESAIALAFSRDITIYDAAYIAVSQTYHIPLITADYKLLAKIKNIPLVMPLKEMKL